MVYVWRKLASPLQEAAWEEHLAAQSQDLVITAMPRRKRIQLELYCASVEEASSLRERFGGSVRKLETTDWAETSAPRPILVKIRDRLIVTSQRSPQAVGALERAFPGRVILSIPPELAFGTGDHATTATCLRLLADQLGSRAASAPRGWRVLDLGTGTAVLAMAAKRLGAETVEAWDCDPLAIETAGRNLRANGFAEGEIVLRQRDVLSWHPRQARWRLITANLFSEVLRPLFPKLREALQAEGRLIISGMLVSQADETLEAAQQAGFKLLKRVRRGRWVSALCA